MVVVDGGVAVGEMAVDDTEVDVDVEPRRRVVDFWSKGDEDGDDSNDSDERGRPRRGRGPALFGGPLRVQPPRYCHHDDDCSFYLDQDIAALFISDVDGLLGLPLLWRAIQQHAAATTTTTGTTTTGTTTAFAKAAPRIPVYATEPVVQFGRYHSHWGECIHVILPSSYVR